MEEYTKKIKKPYQSSERPKEGIVLKKSLSFRINRALTGMFNFFYRKGLDYHALNPEESLNLLLRTKKSYIRFGNGESEILVGLGMYTQEFDRDLQKDLREIIQNYSSASNYLVGIANWRLTRGVKELKATPRKNAYKIWRFMRYMFWKLDMGKKNAPFLEADMFRIWDNGLPRNKIELLWADVSNIFVLYNSEAHFRRFRDSHKNKNIYFVKIPDKNFYSVLPGIQADIINLIQEHNIDTKDLAILVSAGPGANVICYNLCQKDNNIRCYDMGNFFHMHYSN